MVDRITAEMKKEISRRIQVMVKKHLHYMKILQKNYEIYQPELRDAIDYAIFILEGMLE
jgi:hypothetical protein